jgi:hypothetical protein
MLVSRSASSAIREDQSTGYRPRSLCFFEMHIIRKWVCCGSQAPVRRRCEANEKGEMDATFVQQHCSARQPYPPTPPAPPVALHRISAPADACVLESAVRAVSFCVERACVWPLHHAVSLDEPTLRRRLARIIALPRWPSVSDRPVSWDDLPASSSLPHYS